MKSLYSRGIYHTNTSPDLYSNNQKIFPSKYIQEKYPLLNEVVPKYSILYKVKYKPDFAINEYLKNARIDSPEAINFINNQKYISQNQNYEENTNNTLLNELEENEAQNQKYNNINCKIIENNFYDNKILYDVSPIRDIENSPNNNINIPKKLLIERRNLNNNEFSNLNSYLNSLSNSAERKNPLLKNNTIERKNPLLKNIIRQRKNPLLKNSYTIDNNYNYLKTEKVRKKIIKLENEYTNNFLKTSKARNNDNTFNSPMELNIEENLEKNKDKNLYLNFMKNNNYSERNRKYNFNKNNTYNNPKLESSTRNFINIQGKDYIEDFNDSFKYKRKRFHYFSPIQKTRKILEKSGNNHYSNIDYININRNLNTKLKKYRIKLCIEFCRHFNQFYKMLLKKYFLYFIQKLDNDYDNDNDNDNNNNNNNYTYFYNKRNKFNDCKNIKSTGAFKDFYKNNTVNDYETLYKKISKRTLYLNKASTINNSNSNNINNMYNCTNNLNSANNYTLNISKNNTLNNETMSNSSKYKYNIQSVPRSKKISLNNNNSNDNSNILSARRNPNSKLLDSNSFSPSFHIGKRTIINRDISFRNEGNTKENELFRDTKELNKKFWQIHTRKIRSKNKDGYKNRNKDQIKRNNMTLNTSEIRHEFDEIRKYIKSIKKDKEQKSSRKKNKNKTFNDEKFDNKTLNNMNHYKKKHLIKVSNLDYNVLNDNNNNNEIYDYNYENDTNQNYEKKKRFERNKKIDKIINKYRSFKNYAKDNYKTCHNYNNNINSINKIEPSNSSLNSLSSINYNKKNKLIYISKDLKLNNNAIKKPSIKNMKSSNKVFPGYQQHNIQNIYSPNKHIIYYSKTNDNKHKKKEIYKKIKVFSMLIKNIVTKDKRIHITINYYFYKNKKSLVKRYDFLEPSEKFSLNIICGSNNYKKAKDQKLKLKLSEIKEEDIPSTKYSNIFESYNSDKNYHKKEFIKEEINSYYYENNNQNKNKKIRKIPKNIIYNKKK